MKKDHSQFIIGELQRLGHPYKQAKGWIKIKCLSGKHVDRSPSMGVCREGDGNVPAKCLVCGAVMSWNGRPGRPGIAEILKLTPIEGKRRKVGDPEYQVDDELAAMGAELEQITAAEAKTHHAVRLPKLIEPWTSDYVRGDITLSAKMLSKVPSYRWYDAPQGSTGDVIERILWPISVDNVIYGYTGRRLDDDKFMRYNSSADLPAPRLLFPYDYYKRLRTVVLVEGPVDALRLIDYGIPAMAILGTGTWSKAKRNLLIKKGVRNVLLCFDGDKAGRICTATFNRKLKKYFNVAYLELPEGTDPGNVKTKILKKIKRLVDDGF